MVQTKLNNSLFKELTRKMSLTRLSKAGLFKRIEVPPEDVYIQREVYLFRCVLDRALIDLFSRREELRDEVITWLDVHNPSFKEVCELAMLDEDDVYSVFQEVKRILKGHKARFRDIGETIAEAKERISQEDESHK